MEIIFSSCPFWTFFLTRNQSWRIGELYMFYSKGKKKRTLKNFKQKSKFAFQEDQTSGSVKKRQWQRKSIRGWFQKSRREMVSIWRQWQRMRRGSRFQGLLRYRIVNIWVWIWNREQERRIMFFWIGVIKCMELPITEKTEEMIGSVEGKGNI